ncbi:MAG: hypothetical protein M3P50_08460, partial [Actinomycetota bacterium]|nr:hypothetical protein [Actinomycetota bacterium]
MTANDIPAPALSDHLPEPLRLGEPDVHGPLAVFPVFGPTPVLEYVSFARARAYGISIRELPSGASVNDLVVLNPTDHTVLLYEGEEILGAQQNRTFDVSVLVGPRSELQVPVSCVEAGRWDGRRSEEEFSPAPQAAYPALRSRKNRAARLSVAAGMAPRAAQGEVWEEVAHKSARMDVASATGAMHDIYDGRRDRLAEVQRAVRIHGGQTGALLAIGGRPVVLDHVSRPDVFAGLHAPLLQGYALDALEAQGAPEAPDAERAAAFLGQVLGARTSERDGIGLGRDVRFAGGG